MFRSAPFCRSLFQRLNLPEFPNRGRQLQSDDLFLFAAPKARHEQDATAQSCVTQRNCFVERGNTKPLPALGLQRQRALDRTVPVGVSFNDRTDGYVGPYMLLQSAKVLPQAR